MSKRLIALMIASFPGVSYAGDYVGDVPPDCQRFPFQSKFELQTSQSCPVGHAVRTVSFEHKFDENGTHQESFQLLCCKNRYQTRNCGMSEFISNFQIFTLNEAPPKNVVTGLHFQHNLDENGTHQQRFAIEFCETEREMPSGGLDMGGKFELKTEFRCFAHMAWRKPAWSAWGSPPELYEPPQFLKSIGFFHPPDQNGTHQETVLQFCVQD